VRTGRDISPLLEPPAGGHRPDYVSTRFLSRLAVALLLLTAALLAYQAYVNGVTVPGLVVMAVAVAVSLAWLRRAYRNLAALGVGETRDSPASAVAWFLIPVANWLMTYPVLRDLYRLSDRSDPHGLNHSRSLLVSLWWLCWAAPPVASIFSLMFLDRPGLGTTAARGQALISFDFISLAVAAVLGAIIIIRVTSLQEASRRWLEKYEDAGL
jgi:hypothetical protein